LSTADGLARTSVLVTGASGFLGAPLVEALVARGARVTAVARGRRQDGDRADLVWQRADLADAEAAERVVATAAPDVVFHLASRVTGRRDLEEVLPIFRANLAAAVNLLVATTRSGCRRIVLAGSMEAPGGEPGEAPGSPYAAAKGAQELYARLFHALYGAPVVTARIFMAYGPGQADLAKLVPYAILENLAGRAARIGSGTRPIDWIFVDDVARGLLALADAPGIEGETLDLGSGTTVTVGEIAARIARATGAPLPEVGAMPGRPLETSRVADPARTLARTGFAPEVDLDAGLARTIAWYRSERDAGRL
jgi:nucleoside-diphosphate-sugar epimerase